MLEGSHVNQPAAACESCLKVTRPFLRRKPDGIKKLTAAVAPCGCLDDGAKIKTPAASGKTKPEARNVPDFNRITPRRPDTENDRREKRRGKRNGCDRTTESNSFAGEHADDHAVCRDLPDNHYRRAGYWCDRLGDQMIPTVFATVLMWANACVIVALTMTAYKDALQHKMRDARSHLQIAGMIALVTAAMSSVILHQQKTEAATKSTEVREPSWNAYPTTTASR